MFVTVMSVCVVHVVCGEGERRDTVYKRCTYCSV